MKRIPLVAAAVLFAFLFALPCFAQSGSTTITIVAAVSLGTITPTPTHFYQNTAAPISLASSTNGFNSTCTATAGSTSLPVTYSSSTQALTGTLTAAMTSGAVGSTLTITITCTASPLTLNTPVTLPNASVGQTYSANLSSLANVRGGVPPYTFSMTGGSLPAGLSLSSSGLVTGTPSGAGSFEFDYQVVDSSGTTIKTSTMRGIAA